ncbi:MAG TPA: magnesium chelatase, partial [Dehalococcoidia bacterium]|nr:magnesium chelatase [Dehalococcoidia bacterium]
RSGVSVRASITNYESLLANAQRRAIKLQEKDVVPRVSDLPFLIPSLSGKIEFETVEDGREEQIIEKLIQGAVHSVFNRYYNIGELEEVVMKFKAGSSAEVGPDVPWAEYTALLETVDGLGAAVDKVAAKAKPSEKASAVEFVLEGLHLNKRLNKDRMAGRAQYRG